MLLLLLLIQCKISLYLGTVRPVRCSVGRVGYQGELAVGRINCKPLNRTALGDTRPVPGQKWLVISLRRLLRVELKGEGELIIHSW